MGRQGGELGRMQEVTICLVSDSTQQGTLPGSGGPPGAALPLVA